jgi:hypothetical protein
MSKLFSKTLIRFLISLNLLAITFIFPTLVQAQGTYNFASSSGLSTSAQEAGYITDSSVSTVEDIAGTVIYVALGLVGVIFMILAIYGGVIWMTAQGNEEKVKKANQILMAALFGMIITLAAYVISFFLISYFQ